jgi:hypothetical protein
MRCFPTVTVLALAFSYAAAEQLKPQTAAAFDRYVQLSEQRMARELASGPFLHMDATSAQQRDADYLRLKKGEMITERLETLDGSQRIPVPGGLVHHWMGTVFIPGATLQQTLTFLQDYDNHTKFYGPEVQQSRLVQRNGNDFKVFFRLKKTKVVTVILDANYDVKYTMLGPDRVTSDSYSTRIAEVQSPGKADESEKPVGNDSGFLWRLNSYWRFLERDGGVYVQLEAISLTRDIPAGLGWLISPFITGIPKESLAFTLTRTREALEAK